MSWFIVKSLNDDVIEVVKREFEPICGKPCWLVQRSFAATFNINFGKPHLEVHEYKRRSDTLKQTIKLRRIINVCGDLNIWFDRCYWHIFKGEILLAHNESTDKKIDKALSDLDGQILVSVSVDPNQGTSEFYFEYGNIIKTFPYEDDDDDEENNGDDDVDANWVLFTENKAFSYLCNGGYEYETREKKF